MIGLHKTVSIFPMKWITDWACHANIIPLTVKSQYILSRSKLYLLFFSIEWQIHSKCANCKANYCYVKYHTSSNRQIFIKLISHLRQFIPISNGILVTLMISSDKTSFYSPMRYLDVTLMITSDILSKFLSESWELYKIFTGFPFPIEVFSCHINDFLWWLSLSKL